MNVDNSPETFPLKGSRERVGSWMGMWDQERVVVIVLSRWEVAACLCMDGMTQEGGRENPNNAKAEG